LTASHAGQLERPDLVQPHPPARGLHGPPGRRALLPRHPRQPLEIPRSEPPPSERGRADEHDVVLEQRFGLELGGHDEAADDAELDRVAAHEVERPARGGEAEVDRHGRVQLVEAGDDLGEHVRAGDPRGGQRERADLRVSTCRECAVRVGEKRLGAQHVAGEELARRRERRLPCSASDQQRPELCLERRDVLRHRGLADEQLLGGPRERAPARDRRKRPKPRLQLHEQSLCPV
jgi:hypothetical protein